MRGVAKGALTEEQAKEKYEAWIEAKEAKIAERKAQTAAEIAAFHAMVNGTAPAPKKKAAESSELTTGDGEAKPAEPKTLLETVENTTVESMSGDAPAETAEAPAKEEAAKEEAKPVETAAAAAAAVAVAATEVVTPPAEETGSTDAPAEEVVTEAPVVETAATETVVVTETETVNVGDLDPELAALNAKSEEEE